MPEHTEHDEIMQEMATFLRTLLGAASRLAEQRARKREKMLRDAEARSRTERDQLERRLVAQQKVVDARMRLVHQQDWWENSTPAEQAATYRAAAEWQSRSPAAAVATARMQQEFQNRYGVDVSTLGVADAAIEDLLARSRDQQAAGHQESSREAADRQNVRDLLRDADREDADAQRAETPGATVGETSPAAHTLGEDEPEVDVYDFGGNDCPVQAWPLDNGRGSEPVDQQAPTGSEGPTVDAASAQAVASDFRAHGAAAYDSAERRAATAQLLIDAGVDGEALSARMSADQDQAKPATEAVKGKPGSAPKARKARGTGQNRSRQTDRGR